MDSDIVSEKALEIMCVAMFRQDVERDTWIDAGIYVADGVDGALDYL